MPVHPFEEAIIRAFILPAKRERYVAKLGSAKHRQKILAGLDHCHDFDARYAMPIASSIDIVALLRASGAPQQCRVISAFSEIDGREMELSDALAHAEASRCGTLVCCIAGRLACYIGEDGEQRLLLRRN